MIGTPTAATFRFLLRRLLVLVIALWFLYPIPSLALRVVSLKPNITQTLIDIGQAASVIGITRFCPKPNKQAEIVADYVSIRTEDILRLKPDLIVSSKENSQSRQYALLESAGLKIAYLDFATIGDLLESISQLGVLLADESVSAMAGELRQRLTVLRQVAAKNLSGKTFVVMVQRRPLMIAAGRTFISSLLTEIGLNNVFAANAIPYPSIAEERLLATKPDFILDMSHDEEKGQPFFGREVVLIRIEDFHAAPISIASAEKLVTRLVPRPLTFRCRQTSECKSDRGLVLDNKIINYAGAVLSQGGAP